MILGITRLLPSFAAIGMVFLVGCSASASGPVKITKVNPYHFNSSRLIKTEDRMIAFEHRRLMHGKIENSERRDAMGNYFTVFWKTKTKSPATVLFEYRQGNTGLQVFSKEVQVASPKRSNVTKFEVIGEDYWRDGKVTQWKISIVENGVVVAEYQSFLWR